MPKKKNKIGSIPSVSIIIPTKNSGWILPICLQGINSQKYPKEKIEIIVSDNDSTDNTKAIAHSYGAKVVNVSGKPPLVCQQRNIGAKEAKGEYLLFLDHDMEMSDKLLENFSHIINESKVKYDAWYIPETIKTGSKFLTRVRNFERQFYNNTSIDAVRIISKKAFLDTENQYDIELSNGPADWDLDIQLIANKCKFGCISEGVIHHEERFTLWTYIQKKSDWIGGFDKYKLKWKTKFGGKYYTFISKQLGTKYRLITVFIENGKWKKLISGLHLYLAVILIKLCMILVKK